MSINSATTSSLVISYFKINKQIPAMVEACYTARATTKQ